MIISMRPTPPGKKSTTSGERIREFGYKVHSIEGEERVVIGAVGVGDVTACLESLEATPGWSAPCAFGAVQVRQQGIQAGRSQIKVNGVESAATNSS